MYSYELGTLTAVEDLERFKCYIYGIPVKVITNCSTVKTAIDKRELIPLIPRWWLRIQDYDKDIEHRSKQHMAHVDALSRMSSEESCDIEPATLRIDKADIDSGDWLFNMQLQDTELQELVKKFHDNDKEIRKRYVLHHDRLHKVHNGGRLWVVPETLRYKISQETHERIHHLSIDHTIEKIQ